jgi:glycerate dehydrogenase
MKIVVLDGYTLNPGDLSWSELEALGDCTVHDRTAPEQVAERVREADAVLTNKVALGAETLAQVPGLQYIGVLATGFNIVDVEAARRGGVAVTNVPGYSTDSVAQLTFALLLELTHHVGHHAQTVRAGRWSAGPDFSYQDFPVLELRGLTLGIVGFGQIGQAVARLARCFGLHVLAHRRPRQLADGDWVDIEFVDLDILFRRSDVVSLHCPLTPETAGLIGPDSLRRMKPSAFLLNTSRGPLVDEAALAEALDAGRIAGAGLDVLSREPPLPDNPLLRARNCLVTPHLAWASGAARTRLMTAAVRNLHAFQTGHPLNRVD